VDRGCRQRQETKLSFAALIAPLQPGRKFFARAGAQARRSFAAAARQSRAAVGDHAGGDEARRRRDSRDHAVDAGRTARPSRSRPGESGGGDAGPGRQFKGLGGDHLVRIVVGATSKHDGWLPFEQAADASETFVPDGPTKADDPVLLYFTSGHHSKAKTGAA